MLLFRVDFLSSHNKKVQKVQIQRKQNHQRKNDERDDAIQKKVSFMMMQGEEKNRKSAPNDRSEHDKSQTEENIDDSDERVVVGEACAVLAIFIVIQVGFGHGEDEPGPNQNGHERHRIEADDRSGERCQEEQRVKEEKGDCEILEVGFVLDCAAEKWVHVLGKQFGDGVHFLKL